MRRVPLILIAGAALVRIDGLPISYSASIIALMGTEHEFRASRSAGLHRGGRSGQFSPRGQGAEPVAARAQSPYSEARREPGRGIARAVNTACGADHGRPGLHPKGATVPR